MNEHSFSEPGFNERRFTNCHNCPKEGNIMLELMAEARRQDLLMRETEISQRMNWYDAKAVDRLERALNKARARLRLGTLGLAESRTPAPPKDLLRPGGGSIVGSAR